MPGARIGAIVNDFGDVNVDAALVSGQIDEPASIAASPHCLVAIGMHLDTDAVRSRIADALRPAERPTSATSVRRLRRYAARR